MKTLGEDTKPPQGSDPRVFPKHEDHEDVSWISCFDTKPPQGSDPRVFPKHEDHEDVS